MQKIQKLTLLTIFLITLNNCSNKKITPTDDRVIIKYVDINKTVPSELLVPTEAPSLSLLVDVELCNGKESALQYLKELYDAYYLNKEKILAIKSHLGGTDE